MEIKRKKVQVLGAYAELSSFVEGDGRTSEYHLMLHVSDVSLTFEEQIGALELAYSKALKECKDAHPVFKRYFLSDSANQEAILLDCVAGEGTPCAISAIQQPPLDGTKVALWVYLISEIEAISLSGGLYSVRHGIYTHLWSGGNTNGAANSEYQTRLLFNNYVLTLVGHSATLLNNCVRTWLYVNDIDNNYGGVVKARNEVFSTQGLTEFTHYIASTGIGGRTSDPHSKVMMDAYAVCGLMSGQMGYLYAPSHLNRTHEYGVSFERGAYIDYGDRRQVFISGTASIDNNGKVLYRRDIRRQTDRMLENVEALLSEAGFTFNDMCHIVVYLRDIADYGYVKSVLERRFPSMPIALLHAPVCRSEWLVEMECMGVKSVINSAYHNF